MNKTFPIIAAFSSSRPASFFKDVSLNKQEFLQAKKLLVFCENIVFHCATNVLSICICNQYSDGTLSASS